MTEESCCAIPLSPELVALIRRDDTIKIVATVDERGVPHAVRKGSLTVDEAGKMLFVELIESSRTGRNLLRGLWFEKSCSILVLGPDDEAYEIEGTPLNVHISGPVYQHAYVQYKLRYPGSDPAAVWVIRPDRVVDQSWSVRMAEEHQRHPQFLHLDRLVKDPIPLVGRWLQSLLHDRARADLTSPDR
jgi:hypothetical protein